MTVNVVRVGMTLRMHFRGMEHAQQFAIVMVASGNEVSLIAAALERQV